MKKVVNSVLASALALSVAPMAFAAEEATTAPKMDAALEKTVKRLEALGLVAGYGNGEYGVDKTITRAEFATLIVRMRALEQGAKLAQFQSTFTDVKTADWFSGFVNVASGQEIVKGYADKSFKPQNQVTYAESVAMIIRALGYEPSVKGVWPNNYIAKASELNIAKNISTPNNAATRGDVFKMMDNALRVDLMEQLEYGTDIRFNVTDETLLTKYLDVTVRDMEWAHDSDNDADDLPIVSNVPAIGLGSLKGNEVTLAGKNAGLGNTTYKVADGINPNSFAGQHVQVWIKDDTDNTIVWMEGSEDEEVVMDRTDVFAYKNKTITDGSNLTSKSSLKDLELKLDSSGKAYRFSEDAEAVYNFNTYGDATDGLKDIIKIAQDYVVSVKLVLNEDNEITYIHAVDDASYNQTSNVKYGSEVIEKIDATKLKIENLDGGKYSELDDKEEGRDFLVFLNGQPAKLADLKAMDVYSVYYADGDDEKLLVFASRTVVEGKVDKVVTRNATDLRLTIGDKTYRLRNGATYSENNNEDVETISNDNWDLINDLDGENVKLYLDANGRIRHVQTADNVDDRNVKAIVTRAAVYDASEDKYAFVVMNEKGKKQTISLEAEDIEDVDGVDFGDDKKSEDDILDIFRPSKENPVLVEVSLNSKGEVDKVQLQDVELKHLSNDGWDKAADEDDSVINDGDGEFEVNDDTAIFDMTGDLDENANRPELKDAGIAKFADIADENDLDVYYTVDGDEVESIFVVDGSGLGGDTRYGYVLSYGTAGGVDSVLVLTKDGDSVVQKEFKLDDDKDDLLDDGIKRGDFIAFDLNSDEEVIVNDVVEVVDAAIDSEKARVKVSGDELEDANLDRVTVARVDDVDGDTITYGGKNLYTNATTAYIDAWDDLAGTDGVEEGDLIVLVDTDDDGTRFDYVLVVADEDYLDEENISEAEIKAFLDQSDVDVPDPDADLVDEDSVEVTKEEKFGGMIVEYTVAGEGAKGAEIEVTVGSKTEKKTVGTDGKFSVAVLGKAGETKATLTATLDGETETHDFEIK